MKKEELSDEIGKIDEDIIEEANQKRTGSASGDAPRKKKPILVVTAVFTAAAAAIAGVAVLPQVLGGNNVAVVDNSGSEQQPGITTSVTTGTATGIADEEPTSKNMFTRELRHSDIISDVSAVTTAGDNMMSDSALRITLKGDVSEDVLRKRIKLSPESEFTLTRDSDTTYLLNTVQPFEKGSLVKLAVEDDGGEVCDSWAFRTTEKFAVYETYPQDGSEWASVDSGIEIRFSDEPSLEGVENFFSISPKIEGKFSTIEDTLYFVPDKNMEPKSNYRVTVRAGYKSVNGEALAEDLTFSFRTSSYVTDGTYMFTASSSSGYSESFIPGDQTCVEIYCSRNLRDLEFETHLYSFTNAADYRSAIEKRAGLTGDDDPLTDTSALTEVFSSNEKPFYRPNGDYRPDDSSAVYVLLPEQLEPGYYAADVSVTDSYGTVYSLQYLMQVSDISVYALSLGEENVFFVNDTSTGLPAAGAKVALNIGGKEYKAGVDNDGIAYVTTGGETGRAVLNIEGNGSAYIDSYILSDAENPKYDDLYYSYLYTDREAYLTTDTVNVWGFIIPKAHGTALPTDLKLTFMGGTVPVIPAADGTFTAKFPFKDHNNEWWNPIELRSGDKTILSRSVSVHDYEKPTYVIDIDAPEYLIMPQKDPFDVTVGVSYYEGTPAEGVLVRGSGDNGKTLKTDVEGKAEDTILADYCPSYWESGSCQFSYTITGVENTYSYGWKNIPTLYHDRMMTYDYDRGANTLTVHVNDLDFSRADEFFDTITYDGWYYDGGDYDILKAAPADVPVTISLERRHIEKIETGSYYDYVEKRTVKTYDYNYTSWDEGRRTLNTVNGVCTFTDLPQNTDTDTYSITITLKDKSGYEIEQYVYSSGYDEYFLIGDRYYYRDSGSKVYRLDPVDRDSASPNNYDVYYTFEEDDIVSFRLACSQETGAYDGRLLLAVTRSDFVSYDVYDMNGQSTITYRTTRDCIPDMNYSGAYFDGKHVYRVYGSYMVFDPKKRGITITAESDAPTYDAGDTAEITVTAADENGNAIDGASVLLSVVDEAAFAISDQNEFPLDSIYRFIYYTAPESYISYIQHFSSTSGMGEKGGGGGENIRRDFKDTALFMSSVTDSSGKAHFSVKLPDNMTTWRATVIAVDEKSESVILAGRKCLPIVVTRPVFITPIMHSQFVEGDDISVSAKCAGLNPEGYITVRITGSGIDKTETIKQQQTANFGKLPQGEYTVRFSAMQDGTEDIVEMPLTVTDTLLETDITRRCDLTELAESVKATKWPVRAAFFNKEYMFVTDLLYNLISYSGDSLDARIASAYASVQLGFMSEETFINMFSKETVNGFARKLPAADESLELTALMSIVDPRIISEFARNEITYYNDPGSDNEFEICSAYMALAALGNPVMSDVKNLLAANDDIYTKNGIYLSAALALCGDYRAAYDAYIRFVPEIQINDSNPDAPFAYVADKKGEYSQGLTQSALITASLLNLPEAEYFARKLVSESPVYDSYALQLAIYAANYVPPSGSETVFTYSLNGSEQTVKLERHRPTFLEFTEEQFRNANFKLQSGEVYVIARYTGRVTENQTRPTLKITKTVSGTVAPGEEVTVTIQTEPSSIVYDVVPSCGRLSGSQSGPLVTLYTGESGKAVYKFTVQTAGDYVSESAVVYNYRNGEWGMSDRTSIVVGSADESA